MALLDIEEHTGEPHHIHLDGTFIMDLTNEEIGLIREAFDEGFIISVYDVNERVIAYLYQVILQIPNVHEETQDVTDEEEGDPSRVFTIEQHDGVIWTSMSQHGLEAEIEGPAGDMMDDSEGPSDGTGQFALHAFHKREWIESHQDRKQQLLDLGIIGESSVIGGSAMGVIEDADLMNEYKSLRSDAVTRAGSVTLEDSEGNSILSIANAWLFTNQFHVGFNNSFDIVGEGSATKFNTYSMTTTAWVLTETLQNDTLSFLLVNQDFNLASSNGWQPNQDKSPDGFPRQVYWYLSEFKNINFLKIGSNELDSDTATLFRNEPETNQATTSSVTSSVETSIGGTVGVDSSGGSAAIDGGVSWSTSTTFEKANVSINNISLSQTDLENDASWQYLPRKAEIFDDGCNNSVHNTADLSHNTFTPTQDWIMIIDGSEADNTLKLKTQISMKLTNSYIDSCNGFNCACDVAHQNAVPGAGQVTYTNLLHIPAIP